VDPIRDNGEDGGSGVGGVPLSSPGKWDLIPGLPLHQELFSLFTSTSTFSVAFLLRDHHTHNLSFPPFLAVPVYWETVFRRRRSLLNMNLGS